MSLLPRLPGGFKLTDEGRHTMTILLLLSFGGLFYLALFGVAGQVGVLISQILQILFGVGRFFAPSLLFIIAILMIRVEEVKTQIPEDDGPRLFWGSVMLLLVSSAIFNLFKGVLTIGSAVDGGGVVGYLLYPFILRIFSPIGAGFILFVMLLMCWFVLSQSTFTQAIKVLKQIPANPTKLWGVIPEFLGTIKGDAAQNVQTAATSTNPNFETKQNPSSSNIEQDPDVVDVVNFTSKINGEPVQNRPKPKFNFHKSDSGVMEMAAVKSEAINWDLPPFTLLSEAKSIPESGDIEGNKEIIISAFSHFGIKVEMGQAHIGPTVTQYTLKPANGVKLSAIDALNRDLALALAADALRIEAPIPGQSLVGIEIPNKRKTTVTLREILQTYDFIESEDELPLAIGKDVTGKVMIYPITKMPHILVAGATNSGKSVWLQGALLSLLYRYSHQDLKLILVDMKKVELTLYSKIPHLLSPVITEADKAINALKWTVLEMNRRYTLLEETGKRNIKEYNILVGKDSGKAFPYMVFVIDELGDLMLSAKAEVEPLIVRLTQMSRAVGIHLILATQRPDTTVITGLIKANVPTRLAFAVASAIDSRVILDSGGAEKLLGQGDGLFSSPNLMKPKRIQAAYVSEQEIKMVVDFLINQAKDSGVGYDSSITESPRTSVNIPGLNDDSSFGDGDDKLDEARDLILETGKASASYLQRMLSIGYARAARILDLLEAEGTIGPSNGAKAREIYGRQG